MRNRYFVRIACVMVCISGLSACDQVKRFADIPADIDGAKSQISQVQGHSDAVATEVGELRARVAALDMRLSTLERAQVRVKTGPEPLDPQQVTSLNSLVADCVKEVRSAAPADSGFNTIDRRFWTGFDAFYNPGTGKVQNNVVYNGERPALYAFNKCMSARGIPLT
jgi:hypothetical protein